jgi:hypothetical protein
MRFQCSILAFASVVIALPQAPHTATPQEGLSGLLGGLDRANSVSNDLLAPKLANSCHDIYFVMARGSTEPGNMDRITAPVLTFMHANPTSDSDRALKWLIFVFKELPCDLVFASF